MAPLTRRRKKALAAAAPDIDPADRLSKLPDGVLAQIISSLPAQEAVRTCVLARAWRHVWKMTKRLVITVGAVHEVQEFVDRLLQLRLDGLEFASLDSCVILLFNPHDGDDHSLDDDEWSIVHSWIRRVLQCQVQALQVMCNLPTFFDIYFEALVSPNLTKLELIGVRMWRRLNFSACPALECLEISNCMLLGMRKMTSRSLKYLIITSSKSSGDLLRFKICVPRLVSLRLEVEDFRAPLLERMPELVEAYVHIGRCSEDECSCDDPMGCYHVTRDGHISDDDDDDPRGYAEQITAKSVLLDGLAQAQHLVLTAADSKYIVRRDLRWCPTFSMLKTLVISNHLFESADCSALACILEHASILEKLTLIYSEKFISKYKVTLKGSLGITTEESTMISQHLR